MRKTTEKEFENKIIEVCEKKERKKVGILSKRVENQIVKTHKNTIKKWMEDGIIRDARIDL